MKNHNHYNYAGDTGISGKHRNRLQRDNEFIKAYRTVLDLMLERGVPNARWAAIHFTVFHSHPHYHVSYDRAYVVVSNILNGKSPIKPSLQASMWQEIASKVKQLCTSSQISVARATEWVLDNCRASRFFITPHYAYHHIRHLNPSLNLLNP